MPTQASPSITRIVRSASATIGISSCTCASAATVGPSAGAAPFAGVMIARAVSTCARGTSFVKSAT